jgi:transcriptional regulator with XRE-family HTH domain
VRATGTVAGPRQRQVGELLRHWRDQRRLSQLELSVRAEISTRHLSFLETSRSMPSRDMVLHLAEQLDVPLRDRNEMLLAAGYAPVYRQTPLELLEAPRRAIRQVLRGHEPYPAVVVDQSWNVVDRNTSVGVFLAGAAPELIEPPANVLRISLHPDGMAPRIVNLAEWRAHLLSRLRRQIELTADPELTKLHQELLRYPGGQPERVAELPGPGEVMVPLRLRHEGRELSFFSTVATFGTPLDITLAELAIESFFPADPQTAQVLREQATRAAAGPSGPG